MQRRALKSSLVLLEAFSPDQWGEEDIVRNPPFITEDVDGTVMIVPNSLEAERVLDIVSAPLGLKKTKNGRLVYLTGRADTVRAIRLFSWYVRRSWRNRDLAILWALAHQLGNLDEPHAPIAVQSISAMTNSSPKQVSDIMGGLRRPTGSTGHGNGFGEYEVDGALLRRKLEDHLDETPTQTQELIMESLCSGIGSSVNDIYNRSFPRELTVGAVYKVSEELKRDGYVQVLKHFRVNDRGPMRELLGADCRNCFYGYTNPDRCFDDAFRELEHMLKRYYGKELSEEERANSYSAIKSAPFGPKVMRKVLEALKLIHHIDVLMSEKNVVSVLRKLEEWYDVEFPVYRGSGTTTTTTTNIGPGG